MPMYEKKDAGSRRLLPEAEIERRARELAAEMKPNGTGRTKCPPHVATDIADLDRSARRTADAVAAERGWKRLERVTAADLDNYDDGGFRSFGEFLRAVKDARLAGRWDKRLEGLGERKDLSTFQGESTGADGGFVVPAQFEAMVRMRMDEAAPWLASTTQYQATRNSVAVPGIADEDKSSDEIAGFKLTRTGEGSTIAPDKVQFTLKEMRLRKAAGLCQVSNELLTDEAVGVDALMSRVFGRAAAMLRADDFVRGNGSGEPLGILNSSGTYSVAKESGQTADTVVFENVYKMFARLAPESQSRAFWLMHLSVLPQLVQFVGGSGTDLGPNWMINAAERPNSLLGLPIRFHESASLLGDLGDVMLVDPSWYLYVSQPLRIDVSEHRYFEEDAVAYRVVLRDDGQPFYNSTWQDTQGYEIAPFVTLAERT